jgi:hypothetical protein
MARALVKDSNGANLLHEDILSKLSELLGGTDDDAEAEQEVDQLSRFLVLLLSTGKARADIEQEVNDVMPEDIGPEFVDWCERGDRRAGRRGLWAGGAAADDEGHPSMAAARARRQPARRAAHGPAGRRRPRTALSAPAGCTKPWIRTPTATFQQSEPRVRSGAAPTESSGLRVRLGIRAPRGRGSAGAGLPQWPPVLLDRASHARPRPSAFTVTSPRLRSRCRQAAAAEAGAAAAGGEEEEEELVQFEAEEDEGVPEEEEAQAAVVEGERAEAAGGEDEEMGEAAGGRKRKAM